MSRADGMRCGGVEITRPMWVEAGILFVLLIPFYAWLLREPAPLKVLGFVEVALISAYIIWFSPHRIMTPAARKSLLEVPAMVAWSMFWIWVVLPAGPVGRVVGQTVLTATAIYIIFFARRRHGDTLEDWGMGSLAAHWDYLRHGRHRVAAWLALVGVNLLIVITVFWARDIAVGIIGGALRRMGGYRMKADVPAEVLLLVGIGIANLLLLVVARYDNWRHAARTIGTYVLGGSLFVAVVGYIYIYVVNNGWVEFQAQRGFTRVGAYVLWGTLQELLFLSYFNTRIRKGLNSPILAALLTAIVFSIYHLTAYTLMALCFLVGIIWALIFQAAPNLLMLGATHGLSGGFGSAFEVKGFTMFKIKGSVGPFNM